MRPLNAMVQAGKEHIGAQGLQKGAHPCQMGAQQTGWACMTADLHFAASPAPVAQQARASLVARYGDTPMEDARIIVALGGDGFMLQTLHATEHLTTPVYGMNRGTVGFLMNAYAEEDLPDRLTRAEIVPLNPLRMSATRIDGSVTQALAINEVSLLRQGAQAAKLRILVDGRERLAELVCDGVLLSTPAGSTA
jgi:NAD+ kinase